LPVPFQNSQKNNQADGYAWQDTRKALGLGVPRRGVKCVRSMCVHEATSHDGVSAAMAPRYFVLHGISARGARGHFPIEMFSHDESYVAGVSAAATATTVIGSCGGSYR
jgi:hypothetical protein